MRDMQSKIKLKIDDMVDVSIFYNVALQCKTSKDLCPLTVMDQALISFHAAS